jgi:hypothetical protein
MNMMNIAVFIFCGLTAAYAAQDIRKITVDASAVVGTLKNLQGKTYQRRNAIAE